VRARNQHVLCREVDTGGALIEMTLSGQTQDGRTVQVELMVPGAMVRMIVSAHGDEQFGFQPRVVAAPTQATPAVGRGLPRRRQAASAPVSADSADPGAAQTLTRVPTARSRTA
jgi:hypothetical protein